MQTKDKAGNGPKETPESLVTNNKQPIPKWLWVIGVLGLMAQQAGYQLTRHYELVNVLFLFFAVSWLIVFFRKQAGR